MNNIIGNINVDDLLIAPKNEDTLLVGDRFSFDLILDQLGGFVLYRAADDTLIGGSGNDSLYGDFKYYFVTGAVFDVLTPIPPLPTTFAFGDDKLWGGNGNDLLVGDSSLNNSIVGQNTILGNPFDPTNIPVPQSGSNVLHGENGNDKLIGNFETLNILISDTLIIPNQITEGDIPGGIFYFDSIFAIHGNELYGGNGNDLLIGNFEKYFFNATNGGLLIGGNSIYTAQNASNILDGGSGNDILIGNMGLFSGQLTNGAYVINHNGLFSSDVLIGGAGNDLIIGDSYHELYSFGENELNNNFISVRIFGSDTINGGSGNDIIYGDFVHVENYSIEPDFSLTKIPATAYVGGNDIITGGDGSDIFVYSKEASNGNDIILDFNLGVDAIGMTGGLTKSDLHASEVGGNLVLSFDTPADTSLVTLVGVSLASLTDVTFVNVPIGALY